MKISPLMLILGVLLACMGLFLQLIFVAGSVLTLIDLLAFFTTLLGLGAALAGFAGYKLDEQEPTLYDQETEGRY